VETEENDDMNNLMVTHQIQRGRSRVSIRKPKNKTEKLVVRERDLKQELKDKEFQVRCIQELLDDDITNEVKILYSAYALIVTSLIDTFSLIDTLFWVIFYPLIDTFP